MIKEEMKEKMKNEAVLRMQELGVEVTDQQNFISANKITTVFVDHENKGICYEALTDEEIKMIHKIEEEREALVYYVIHDKGYWTDGTHFERYSLLYVDSVESDWGLVRKECIKQFGTVFAYVVNVDEPDYTENTEICFKNVSGRIINIS